MLKPNIDGPLGRYIADLDEQGIGPGLIDEIEELAVGTVDDGQQSNRSARGVDFTINTLVPTIFRSIGAQIAPEEWAFDAEDPKLIDAIDDAKRSSVDARPRSSKQPGYLDLYYGTGIKGVSELTYQYYRQHQDLSETTVSSLDTIARLFSSHLRFVIDTDGVLKAEFNDLNLRFLRDLVGAPAHSR